MMLHPLQIDVLFVQLRVVRLVVYQQVVLLTDDVLVRRKQVRVYPRNCKGCLIVFEEVLDHATIEVGQILVRKRFDT